MRRLALNKYLSPLKSHYKTPASFKYNNKLKFFVFSELARFWIGKKQKWTSQRRGRSHLLNNHVNIMSMLYAMY